MPAMLRPSDLGPMRAALELHLKLPGRLPVCLVVREEDSGDASGVGNALTVAAAMVATTARRNNILAECATEEPHSS